MKRFKQSRVGELLVPVFPQNMIIGLCDILDDLKILFFLNGCWNGELWFTHKRFRNSWTEIDPHIQFTVHRFYRFSFHMVDCIEYDCAFCSATVTLCGTMRSIREYITWGINYVLSSIWYVPVLQHVCVTFVQWHLKKFICLYKRMEHGNHAFRSFANHLYCFAIVH